MVSGSDFPLNQYWLTKMMWNEDFPIDQTKVMDQ